MPEPGSSSLDIGPWAGALIALAALALVLGDVWLRRRHRLTTWIADPKRLLATPALSGGGLWIAVPLALLAAASAVPHAWSVAAPLTAWLAALVLAGAGHMGRLAPLSAAGLLLAGLGLAAVPRTWFGVRDPAASIGLSLAALWMLWLAQFWKQQLLNGQAWTTAGRLIPATRVCMLLLTGGMLVGALLARLGPVAEVQSTAWTALLGSGLQILLVFACWRRAMLDNSAACALGGGLAACAAALAPWIPGVEPLFLLALISASAIFLAGRAGAALGLVAHPLVMLVIPCIGVLVALAAPWSGLSALGLGLIGLSAFGGAAAWVSRAGATQP